MSRSAARDFSPSTWILPLIALAMFGGCGNPDPIRSYTVERPAPSHRMLGAIIPQSDRTWFFKVTGSNKLLSEKQSAFREFLESIHFEGGEPKWTLPATWKRRPGGGFRFATLEMDSSGPPLELSVTALSTPPQDQAGYILSNVNRWRDQLQLGPLRASQLDAETTAIVLDEASGLTATFVEIEGTMAAGDRVPAGTGGSPPFAGSGRAGPPPQAKPQIEFDQPEGWEPAERVSSRGGFRIERAAVFTVHGDEQQAEISVTSLGSAADRLSNVNRWRGIVGLPPISVEELELDPIDFAGSSGDYVEIIGAARAILGVIAVHNNLAWFVKLDGPHELAIRERERFKQFVSSIRIKD